MAGDGSVGCDRRHPDLVRLFIILGLFAGRLIGAALFPAMLVSFPVIFAVYAGAAVLEDRRAELEDLEAREEIDAAISELEGRRAARSEARIAPAPSPHGRAAGEPTDAGPPRPRTSPGRR